MRLALTSPALSSSLSVQPTSTQLRYRNVETVEMNEWMLSLTHRHEGLDNRGGSTPSLTPW